MKTNHRSGDLGSVCRGLSGRWSTHLSALLAALLMAAGHFAALAGEVPLIETPAGDMTGIALGFHTYLRKGEKGNVLDYSAITQLSDKLGRHPALIQGFYPWKNADGSYCAFPQDFADYAISQGATPLITWQPGQADKQNHVERTQADWTCVDIASGRDDAYMREWAAAVKAWPHTVYVRLMHEFNATPYPWAYAVDHVKNSPEKYIAAFRHVVEIFHLLSVRNVQFIWCFGCGAQQPPPENWFPGDDCIEWIGLDGYNHGYNKDGGKRNWQSLEQIFAPSYARLTKISQRPVMIAEIASVEDVDAKGSTRIVNRSAKPHWINESFLQDIPRKMPRVKAVVLFNSVGHNFPTYLIDSSPDSLAAFQNVAANPLYQAAAPVAPMKY